MLCLDDIMIFLERRRLGDIPFQWCKWWGCPPSKALPALLPVCIKSFYSISSLKNPYYTMLLYILDTYVYTKYDPAFWCVYEVDFFLKTSLFVLVCMSVGRMGHPRRPCWNMPANILAQGTIFSGVSCGGVIWQRFRVPTLLIPVLRLSSLGTRFWTPPFWDCAMSVHAYFMIVGPDMRL